MADIADYPDDFRLALVARTRRAWVTPTLVGINIAVLAAMTATWIDPWAPKTDELLRWGADYAPYTTAGQWWRLLTSTFVHAGAPHLAMNMTVLLQLGPLVERLFGSRGFVIAYLVSGLCGSVASIAWNPFAVSVGASGAIFGVFGLLVAYWVRYRASIPREVLRPLQRNGAIFIGLNIVFGLVLKNVDVAAHIGGVVGGFGAGLVIARPLWIKVSGAPFRREALVMIVGLVVVTGTSALLPRAFDLRAELADFDPHQSGAMRSYNMAVRQRRAHTLSDADLAKLIDQQMLPPLQGHKQRLVALRRVPRAQQDRLDRRVRYVALRERAWSLLSEALQNGDRAKAAESMKVHDEADDLRESDKVANK